MIRDGAIRCRGYTGLVVSGISRFVVSVHWPWLSPLVAIRPPTRSRPVPALVQHDAAEPVRPELIVLEPDSVRPGEFISIFFPDERLRGVHFVLESRHTEGWNLEYHLISDWGDGRATESHRPGRSMGGCQHSRHRGIRRWTRRGLCPCRRRSRQLPGLHRELAPEHLRITHGQACCVETRRRAQPPPLDDVAYVGVPRTDGGSGGRSIGGAQRAVRGVRLVVGGCGGVWAGPRMVTPDWRAWSGVIRPRRTPTTGSAGPVRDDVWLAGASGGKLHATGSRFEGEHVVVGGEFHGEVAAIEQARRDGAETRGYILKD